MATVLTPLALLAISHPGDPQAAVAAFSDLIGRSIDEAGLRGLPGLFLIEIDRDGETLPAVSANVRLAAGDHLVFAGVVDSVVDLQRFSGLRPATDQVFKLDNPRSNRRLHRHLPQHRRAPNPRPCVRPPCPVGGTNAGSR